MNKFNPSIDVWNRLTINLRIQEKFNKVNRWALNHGYIEIHSDDITITKYKKDDQVIRFDHSDGSLKSE